ncbi:ABC transporter substrate-binding protein [Paenibacillus macquariensis]|uniref:Carbohydrate ABC transporter substrate-binding protein, CUT1 family n=1 Tax=Paenibacillus macquariensis TaxID=948756 RepID=A0ABY1KAV2_9BACL|nr:ABC transporter substrate-binding protein [Paenibacillus macquariensis]MEC0089468.1 ABC transporter substrate-binding protein [Paenibacillus macquariensis]SIR52428.1 carbohydrate ABC transporter substrate-binding protein, CUT1 family [Paenibacillus macquariensis]
MSVFKRLSALSLIATFTLLTACGENAGTGNITAANGETKTPSVEAAPVQSDPVTIEFWYGLGGKLGENMEKLIQKFNASQQEVIVKGIVQADYTETEQKLQAAIATGQVPAAVLSSNVDWARKGYFAPIDELMAQQSDFNKDDFIQTFLNQGQVDGKQYFLPMYGTTQIMYYRKDAFEKNGIKADDLKTWEDLAAAAKKMTVKNGDKTSVFGWEPMWGAANMIDASLSKGGSILSEDGKEVMIDSPEWIQTWDFFRKLIHEDKTMRIHSGGQGWEYWYKTIDDVMKGQAAGYTGSSGDQGDLDFSIISAMEQPGWAGVGEGKPTAEALMAGIPSKASDIDKKAAMKWLTYFTNSENTAFWSINTGYISVRQSASKDPAFISFSESNPQIEIPLQQASHASAPFLDPTGGKISDALKIAADKVQIENVPAAEALREAKETAQAALDKLK